jgi:hypothetical protein
MHLMTLKLIYNMGVTVVGTLGISECFRLICLINILIEDYIGLYFNNHFHLFLRYGDILIF